MITPISVDGIIYVHGTFAIDQHKLDTEKPMLELHPTGDGFKRWIEQQEAATFHFDAYQELRQLSWMQNNGYTHIIVRPDTPEEIVNWNEPATVPGVARLWYVGTPGLAVQRFWEVMNQVAVMPDACIIAGWQLRSELWPKLVTLGLRHGVRIDQAFRTDPLSRFSTIKTLLDVSEIYSQGAYAGVRKVPELPDALAYFGMQQVCPVNPNVSANELALYTPEDWKRKGHLQVTSMLYGLQSLVRWYYA